MSSSEHFLFSYWAQWLLVQACGGFMDADYRCTFECRHKDEGGVGTWTWLNKTVKNSGNTRFKLGGKKSCIFRRHKPGDFLPVNFPIRNINTNIIYGIIALCQWYPSMHVILKIKKMSHHRLRTACYQTLHQTLIFPSNLLNLSHPTNPTSPSRMMASRSVFKWSVYLAVSFAVSVALVHMNKMSSHTWL